MLQVAIKLRNVQTRLPKSARQVQSYRIALGSSSLHALQFGWGEKLLICFHGYGEQAARFLFLQSALQQRYRIVALDLPFHGQTQWQPTQALTPEQLAEAINYILRRNERVTCSLLGFSLGARLAMSVVAQGIPVDQLVLLAPDVLGPKAWYDIAVYSVWGRALARLFVLRPEPFWVLAKGLVAAGWMAPSLIRFAQSYTQTRVERQRIIDTWMALREMKITLPEWIRMVNQSSVKVVLIAGRYDKIIHQKSLHHFKEFVPACRLIILDKGHNLLTDELNQLFQEVLAG